MVEPVVILGSGQAGFQAAASLRQDGYDGEIVLVGEEPGVPYQRPPLSKAYIKDGIQDRLAFRNDAFFVKNRIELIDGVRAEVIDTKSKRVSFSQGTSRSYSHLIFATGARNRRVEIPGIDSENVFGLRTLQDALTVREALRHCERVVIIGGGFIGLEIGATANALGKRVVILEATNRLMSRVVSEPVSTFFERGHRASGIDVRLNTLVDRFVVSASRVTGVQTRDGSFVEADIIIVAAGVVPNSELADRAGLHALDGVRVNGHLRTEDPSISAIGDCASFPLGDDGRYVRLESVQNAVDQAKCVSAGLVGRPEYYARLPWFWSDQGPWKLQIAGLTAGTDQWIVREAEGRVSVFCFSRGQLIGVETVNAVANHMAARSLLSRTPPVTLDELASVQFEISALRER